MVLLEDENKENQPLNNQIDTEWLIDEKETILIYGAAKCGKTWAYCSYIEDTINKGNKVYIINTDSGVAKTLKQYFGEEKAKEIAKNINYKFVTNMNEAMQVTDEIKNCVNRNDLIIIDLLSEFWDMAQQKFLADISGGRVEEYIVRASKDIKKFGVFEGKMWSYVRSFHDYIVKPFTSRAVCNVIAVCSQKDLEAEKQMSGGKITRPEYITAGAKPGGAPRIDYDFNTIVFIGKKDENHFFQIMGDRGSNVNQNMISFNKNFKEKFEEVRRK